MDRVFEFQPRAFSLCRAMRLFNGGYLILHPSHAYRTLRQYGNVVGTCKCLIFHIGDSTQLLHWDA
jgi:hypothetical protein